jgi:hypothetical protein
VRSVVAELIIERPGLRLGSDLAPFSMEPVTRYMLGGDHVVRLDQTLGESNSRGIDIAATDRLLTATPDLGTVVLASDGLIIDMAVGERRLLPIPAADSAVFGSQVLAVRVEHDRLAVETILHNRVTAGFSPSGDRLLLTPHPSFDETVAVLAWPDQRQIATLAPADLDVDDSFDWYGFFIRDHHIVLKTIEHGLLLCDEGLRPQAWIKVAAPALGDAPEIDEVAALGQNLFAVEHWANGESITAVWRLPHAYVNTTTHTP